ncbi:Dynein light chain, cytoplasmic [Beauveria bassiana]|nr:Dynein light chain, cytoplasmic [Beauveria bassiana]
MRSPRETRHQLQPTTQSFNLFTDNLPQPSTSLSQKQTQNQSQQPSTMAEKGPETPLNRDKLEAQEAMGKFHVEKDIAQHIKRTPDSNTGRIYFDMENTTLTFDLGLQFDERKGPTWHCIVGRNFGSFVTHETKHFIYFYLGHCAILLFKTQ